MENNELHSFFFIGIGGAGMSALARILLSQGYAVAGSDAVSSDNVIELRKLGAQVYVGHQAEHIDRHHPDRVVISQTAIAGDNCELLRARSLGIPLIFRSDLLASLLEQKLSVVIAGTHGKTSTTGMTVTILQKLGIDASYAIGGQILHDSFGGHAGINNIFVCEADESDGSFIKYSPNIAIITNIDPDHMDFFGTEEAYWEGFVQFSRKILPDGVLIICLDTPLSQRLLMQEAESLARRGVTILPYSAQFTILPEELISLSRYLQPLSTIGDYIAQTGKMNLQILGTEYAHTFFTSGIHMVANALAAILACHAISQHKLIDIANFPQLQSTIALVQAVSSFPGTKRRCELRETVANIRIFDDYAHHPTEVEAVIDGLRARYPQSRILIIFQPHMFSRTKDLAHRFRTVLEQADQVNVVDIYPAREQPIPGVDSRLITDGSAKLAYIADLQEAAENIAREAKSGDIILTMGAGTVTKLPQEIAKTLRECFAEEGFSPTLKT